MAKEVRAPWPGVSIPPSYGMNAHLIQIVLSQEPGEEDMNLPTASGPAMPLKLVAQAKLVPRS